jgi:hypothetical protein
LYQSDVGGGVLKRYDPWTHDELENRLSIEILREKRKLEKMTKYHKSVGGATHGENEVNWVSSPYPDWTFENILIMVQNKYGKIL